MNAFRRFVQTFRASRLYGKASRLSDRGEAGRALETVQAALDTLPPDAPGTTLGAAASSIRLSALMLRARAAATTGDVPLALASIRSALPLWTEHRPPDSPKFRSFSEWERWARGYLEERGGGA